MPTFAEQVRLDTAAVLAYRLDALQEARQASTVPEGVSDAPPADVVERVYAEEIRAVSAARARCLEERGLSAP